VYSSSQGCHTATGTHMPHGITQCCLPPGRGDIPALTPAEADTRLSDPGGMQGWVECVFVWADLSSWFLTFDLAKLLTWPAHIAQKLRPKISWFRKIDGRTRPIALSFPITQSVIDYVTRFGASMQFFLVRSRNRKAVGHVTHVLVYFVVSQSTYAVLFHHKMW